MNPNCIWEGCLAEKHYARSLCYNHYMTSHKWEVLQSPNPFEAYAAKKAEKRKRPICVWPDCNTQSVIKTFCNSHYQKALRLDDLVAPWISFELWEEANKPRPCGRSGCEGFTRSKMHELCSKHYAGVLENIRRARKAGSEVETFTLLDVVARDGSICIVCDGDVDMSLKRPHPQSPELDHIIPIAAGGPHTLANAGLAHALCNNRKGTKSLREIREMLCLSQT